MKAKIEKAIIEVLTELNETYANEHLNNLSKDTELYGENGALDSLDLAYLITGLEEKIAEEFNQDLVIADDQTMDPLNSPFNTIEKLSIYIENLLNANE